MLKNKKGFTIIELLIVIAIIGLLATISIVALNGARQKGRDAKRVGDIRQIQTALELYYSNYGEYPTTLGDSIASGTKIYLADVPTAPTPADGDCSDSNNSYTYEVQGTTSASYSISFCLGNSVGEISAGVNLAIPGGITSTTYAWQTVGTAGFSAGKASYTSLAIYNGTPYIAYVDLANSYKATVMKFNGTSWENVGTAGFSAGAAFNTSLAIYNGVPYVAYRDVANPYKATVMKYDVE